MTSWKEIPRGSLKNPEKYFREESASFTDRAVLSSCNSKLCENFPVSPSLSPWVGSETMAKAGVKVMKEVGEKIEMYQDLSHFRYHGRGGKPSPNMKFKVFYYAGCHTLITELTVTRRSFITHK